MYLQGKERKKNLKKSFSKKFQKSLDKPLEIGYNKYIEKRLRLKSARTTETDGKPFECAHGKP